MRYQAICTDIDGTLLDKNRELSQKTIAVIRQVKDKVPVILASSRMPSAMRHLQAQLGISDHPLICYNGGYAIYDAHQNNRTILENVTIPLEICESIVALSKPYNIHISFFEQEHWYAPQVDNWTIREATITKVEACILPNEEVLKQWSISQTQAHKIMCMGEEEAIGAVARALSEKHSEQINIYRSKSTYLEIAPRKISKATALCSLAKDIYNLSMENIVAFGDNYNDIDLLQQVGMGVAVENAREEVKRVATGTTAKSIHDGVAIAIEKYFL